MVTLEAWGLVRKVRSLKRYELTAEGWQLLVRSEETLALSLPI